MKDSALQVTDRNFLTYLYI